MFTTCFSSLGSIAALNVAVTELINKKFNITKKWQKYLISWLFPILISIIGLIFGLGVFATFGTICEPSAWVETIITGLGSALISNGIYDAEYVRQLITLIEEIKINK